MDVSRSRAHACRRAANFIVAVTALIAVNGGGSCSNAAASTYKVLHTFCSKPYCDDGQTPYGGLTMDAVGNLYGTTGRGGRHDNGTVFELLKTQTGWKYKVLYSFCARTNCADGDDPWGNLTLDNKGNLYGTTSGGGNYDYSGGTVFKLVPSTTKRDWKISTLYTFCSKTNCVDGGAPMAGLSYSGQSDGQQYDGKSPLFGTTQYGGTNCQGGCGTVFEINKIAGAWTEEVLYNFCSQGGSRCTDGNGPASSVLVAGKALYGTTFEGGNGNNGGIVFQLTQTNGSWVETVLHDFCSLQNCTDGDLPYGGVIMDSSGNLDGTTSVGGSDCISSYECGVAFQIASDGTETVLQSFCSGSSCVYGSGPVDTPTLDSSGTLYGTTEYEGAGGGGTVFKLGQSFSVLYSFCSQSNCSDGALPYAAVTIDASGNIYGTTTSGGNDQQGGVVFEITP